MLDLHDHFYIPPTLPLERDRLFEGGAYKVTLSPSF